VIRTAKQAAEVIQGAAKTNADEVRAAVLQILAQSDSPEIPAAVLFEIAEVVRPWVDFVVFEYRAAYADRALPFGEQESQRFGKAIRLLDYLEGRYRRVFDAACRAAPADPAWDLRAHALQRCMACLLSEMVEHYSGRQTVGAALWKRLQGHMRSATKEKLESAQVADSLEPGGTGAPRGAYGRALLLSIAQAGAMAQRNLEATLALTSMFADLVDSTMLDEDPARATPASQAATGGVDIQRTGRIRVVVAGGVTHLVNTTRIDAALAAILQGLAAGQTPEQVGLGHVAKADLANLLPRLRRIWCGAGEIRGTQRVASREPVTVAVGFSGISGFFNPEALKPPPEFEVWDYRKGSAPGGKSDVRIEMDREIPPERWKVQDQSAAGMRAQRQVSGARLRRDQLLAVQFESMGRGPGFTLGELRWLQQHLDAEGGISAGIRFLSAHATVALVRIHRLQRGQYQSIGPGFVISDSAHEHLVLPYGWYAPKREAELWHEEKIVPVRFTELRGRGADYEVVAYERL